MKKCSFEGCGRKLHSKKLCMRHYTMMHNRLPLVPIKEPSNNKNKKCIVDKCDRAIHAKLMCTRHYALNKYYTSKKNPEKKSACVIRKLYPHEFEVDSIEHANIRELLGLRHE